MSLIVQTAHFPRVSPKTLYQAYLSSKEHAAMTAESRPAVFTRPTEGEVAHGQEGDELHAFGFTDPDGHSRFSLTARVLQLVPDKVIVLSWKNLAWTCALDPSETTDQDSTVVLTFRENIAGAEVQLVQTNVPEYKVRLPETGEVGSLSSIVNTHWSLLYWEPMKRYFHPMGTREGANA